MKRPLRISTILTLILLFAWPAHPATTRIYPSTTTLPFLSITAGPVAPATNDGAALGTTTLGWSDLHLATGAVINWANAEVTLTETDANTLTLTGGNLFVAANTSIGLDADRYIQFPTTQIIIRHDTQITLQTAAVYLGGGGDTVFGREAAATFQFGLDSATPVTQTFKGADARAGSDSNTIGGRINWRTGLSTGNAVPAIQSLQGGAATVTSGTGAQTVVDRFIPNAFKVLTNNSATAVVNATIANGSAVGGLITYTIEVTDGTDYQVETGQAVYSSQNKAGVIAGTITEANSQQNLSAGTLATTWAISNANPAVISINANSSLTPSTGYPRITFSLSNLGQQAAAIQ